MCAESMSKNWVRCIDIILDCSVTTIYCCGLPSNKCLKLTLPLCPLWCYSSSTALGSENLTLTPSLDLSTLMGVRWETSDLNSWVWLFLGFQNSFPHMTIKSHSHCFLCAHLCHHLLLLYFPETCRAQLPLSLTEPPPYHSPSTPMGVLCQQINKCLYSASSSQWFFQLRLCKLKAKCLTWVASKTLWWPASVRFLKLHFSDF